MQAVMATCISISYVGTQLLEPRIQIEPHRCTNLANVIGQRPTQIGSSFAILRAELGLE